LLSEVADTNGACLASNTITANVDILTSSGERRASGKAYCDIVTALCVTREGAITAGGVLAPGLVALKGTSTGGRVLDSRCIVI
jgi:hypothetical protein